jgi:hypothetical protein
MVARRDSGDTAAWACGRGDWDIAIGAKRQVAD